MNVSSPCPSRRVVLGAGAVLGAGGLAAALSGLASPPDDVMLHILPAGPRGSADVELLAACHELRAARVARDAPGLSDEEAEILDDAWYEVMDRVEGLRPSTLEGMQAKAGAAFEALMDDIHVLLAKSWREQASFRQTFALIALADISGAGFPADPVGAATVAAASADPNAGLLARGAA